MTRLLVAVAALLLPALALAQSFAVPADHLDIARAFAASEAARGGPAPDLAVTDAHAGDVLTYVYLRQSVAGLDVIGTEMTVAVGRAGQVVHAAGTERPQAAYAAARTAPVAALGATAAANALARHNGLAEGIFAVAEARGGADQWTILNEGGIALEPVRARLVWHPEGDALRLAWEVSLYPLDAQHYWLGYVDAATGRVIAQHDLVVHDTFGDTHAHGAAASLAPLASSSAHPLAPMLVGSYTVFAMPLESPYDGGRTAVANPDDALASPFGWHDTNGAAGAEFTTTQGNNVHAYTDTNADNVADAGSSPSGGTSLTFNFALDLAQAPSTYRPASVVNLFYWSNVIHDVMYQYGFTEAAGNFQVNNYGRGGSGNDAVRAEAQDGGGTNNANFSTPVDGSAPRMQMYIGTNPNPDVDGSFDNGVVVHEYGHGISNRLTGGRTTTSCLGNAEQMGEGWSDWYGLMFTMAAGDTGPQARGIGTYLFGQPANGVGIRPAPYSTNFAVNNYTYQRTRSGLSVPHGIGFVWATILWEATWELINVHGFSPDLYNASGTAGNQIMMRLVTEGLKLQPCSPGFVSGRDAILAADAAVYGGAHTALLQAAFARRGLGYSASQGSTGSNGDNTEAFDLWPTGGNQPPNAAFSASCSGLTCSFTDASSDPDGTIASRAWTFGDGGTSTATSPSRTYAAAGTYTVTLTVTDDDGATDVASQSVTVTSPSSLVLSGSRRVQNRRTYVDLTWTGFDGGQVNVYRDGALIGRTTDDGAVTYNLGRNVTGSDTWQVCDREDGACSNVITITYLTGFADGVAAETALGGAFPNPFTSATDVRFSLAEAADVEVTVFNSLGQQVATLAAGLHEAGAHTVAFDAADLPTGVYVIRFRTGDTVQTARVMSVR